MKVGKKKKENIWDPASIAKKIHVPTYDEILEKVKSRYPKSSKNFIKLEITRLESTYNIVYSKTNFIEEVIRLLNSLDEFFWELIKIEFKEDDIRKAIGCIIKARKLVKVFWERYRFQILGAENSREARRVSREGRGRILSTVKRCRRSLELLRNLIIFMSKMPAIDPQLPTVIIAGGPSTGKSTMIRTLSRAQPKVSPYPFTTKEVKVGHITINEDKVQLIDTPGLLDRPPQEMNPIELKAVAALRRLKGIVLLLIDVSPYTTIPIESQVKILDYLRSYLGDKAVYIGINKVDIADRENLELARNIVKEMELKGVIKGYYELVALDEASSLGVVRDIYVKEFKRT